MFLFTSAGRVCVLDVCLEPFAVLENLFQSDPSFHFPSSGMQSVNALVTKDKEEVICVSFNGPNLT